MTSWLRKITPGDVIKGLGVALAIGGAFIVMKLDINTLQRDMTAVRTDVAEIGTKVEKLTDRFIDRGFTTLGMRDGRE